MQVQWWGKGEGGRGMNKTGKRIPRKPPPYVVISPPARGPELLPSFAPPQSLSDHAVQLERTCGAGDGRLEVSDCGLPSQPAPSLTIRRRGLGALIAERFASEGSHVAINYNASKSRADELAEKLQREHGARVAVIQGVRDMCFQQ